MAMLVRVNAVAKVMLPLTANAFQQERYEVRVQRFRDFWIQISEGFRVALTQIRRYLHTCYDDSNIRILRSGLLGSFD